MLSSYDGQHYLILRHCHHWLIDQAASLNSEIIAYTACAYGITATASSARKGWTSQVDFGREPSRAEPGIWPSTLSFFAFSNSRNSSGHPQNIKDFPRHPRTPQEKHRNSVNKKSSKILGFLLFFSGRSRHSKRILNIFGVP